MIKRWKEAKATSASEADYRKEISGKLRDKIVRQRNYRKSFVIAQYWNSVLKWLDSQYKGNIYVTLYGAKYPKEVLYWEIKKVTITLNEAISEMKYLEQALVNDGLSKEEIDGVISGRYKKTEWALKESEKREKSLNKS